jgi:prepilin-type processing-associated H-X9-DG protein
MRRAYSIIGLLVTMTCILVLAVVLLTALNQSITGGGSTRPNTVRSFQDELLLAGLFQSFHIGSQLDAGGWPVPSEASGGDWSEDTTANLFSLLVALRMVAPENLISANERNPVVQVKADYDYGMIRPDRGLHWDPSFRANLEKESNVSFAHMPLFGERFDRYWGPSLASSFPLFGNRGPMNGTVNATSYTMGLDGSWGAHIVFGDGHVAFTDSFTLGGRTVEVDGVSKADNLYVMEEGPNGDDAILSFTREMSEHGPVLQFD